MALQLGALHLGLAGRAALGTLSSARRPEAPQEGNAIPAGRWLDVDGNRGPARQSPRAMPECGLADPGEPAIRRGIPR